MTTLTAPTVCPVVNQDELQAASPLAHGENDQRPEMALKIDPFTYTLAALPHLEQRLKWGKVTTLEGQPIADLWAFLRAAETGQL